MSLNNRQVWIDLLVALALYAVVLIYQGYQYGQSDQSQILPCIWQQDHPESYPADHYVQFYNHSPFNERTIIHFLYRFLGYNIPWVMFFWHMILSVAIITAWIRIANFFIRNKAFQWLAIGLILTIGHHTNTGSNEIYYNAVVPSLAAKALASWAIVCWLTSRFSRGNMLLIGATLLQPLVGVQLFY